MKRALSQSELQNALSIIRSTPGYEAVGEELARMADRGRILFDHELEDRAQAGLTRVIVLGPEAVGDGLLSLAETLVHELYHLHQNPFLKTASFWSGIATRSPVMRRYEQPAYQAAVDFLEAVKQAHPHLADEAAREQAAIRASFQADYGAALR